VITFPSNLPAEEMTKFDKEGERKEEINVLSTTTFPLDEICGVVEGVILLFGKSYLKYSLKVLNSAIILDRPLNHIGDFGGKD